MDEGIAFVSIIVDGVGRAQAAKKLRVIKHRLNGIIFLTVRSFVALC